jgi:hypothetical protein
MMMTVLRQGQPTKQLDHLACVDIAIDSEAAEMILHANNQQTAVLVGTELGEVIIKPAEASDATVRFEDLYDTAVSIREYRKMVRLRLSSTEQFPPIPFEAEILMSEINFVPRVRIRFQAKSEQTARAALNALVNKPDFREQLLRRIVMQMINSEHVSLTTKGCQQIDDAVLEGMAEYEFMDDD